MSRFIATFDFCTQSTNKKGVTMLTTRYSNAVSASFPSIQKARIFGQGILNGLFIRYSKPAVRMHITSNHSYATITEEITN